MRMVVGTSLLSGVADVGAYLGELTLPLSSVDVCGCFATAVDDCGMVTVAQQLPDLLQRQLGVLAEKVHREVPGLRDRPGAAGAGEALRGQAEVTGDAPDNRLR